MKGKALLSKKNDPKGSIQKEDNRGPRSDPRGIPYGPVLEVRSIPDALGGLCDPSG